MAILIILFLLAIIVPTVLIVFLVKFLSKDNELFETKIRNIYCYIVMIITLFLSIFGIISLISNLGELFFPDIPINNQDYNSYYSNILSSFGFLIVCLPVFLYHRNIVEKINKK